ncbi:MAG: mechanosensitive ion channel family protein [Leptolyngbya sp.]|nr:mechanosensitive ion channel family protein [Leptolyngbya sp.]
MVILATMVALMQGWGWGPALAQLPNPLGGSGNGGPPLGVQRIGVLEVTPLILDGNTLFDIASPVVFNRSEPGDLVPVEVRARQVETHLNQVVGQALQYRNLNGIDLNGEPDASTLDSQDFIQVRIEEINQLPVLMAIVGHLPDPRGLLTVTDSDAQYHGLTKLELAETWQTILEEALQDALVSRLPGALRQRLRRTGLIVLAGLLGTLALAGTWQMLGWHKHRLEQRKANQGRHLPPALADSPGDPQSAVWPYTISLDHRLQLVALLRWLMFWGMAFVWIMALAGVMYQFPQTRRYAVGLFSTPVLLLLTWFVTGLINRVANLTIDRIASAWEKNELGSAENIQHKAMRISTITRAAKGFKTTVIYVLALLWVLQMLRLAPASLLAVGALVALALSFAAQNLVKDLVNGFLILLEDQYAIGDLVSTGQVTGIVENLNLRITQIRGEDGRLVTLPNSIISQVENLSRTWSRATIRIDVAYGTQVDHALAVVHRTAQQMGQDPSWSYVILDPTEILGVEAISHAGLTLLLWIRTRPLQQFAVAREFRRRLRLALGQEGIAIGVPQQVFLGDASPATENPLAPALGGEAHD